MPDALEYQTPIDESHRRWSVPAILGFIFTLLWILPAVLFARLKHDYHADGAAAGEIVLAMGIVLCFVGVAQTARAPRLYRGRRLALVGLVVGAGWIVLFAALYLNVLQP